MELLVIGDLRQIWKFEKYSYSGLVSNKRALYMKWAQVKIF